MDLQGMSEWYFEDNGFISELSMNIAHTPIINLVFEGLDCGQQTILDLGCGNGALLWKIWQKNHNVIPYGIDKVPKKIFHSHILLSQFGDNFLVEDMFIPDKIWTKVEYYFMIIFMLGRLLEVSPQTAENLKMLIKRKTSKLIVYMYQDSQNIYGNLDDIAYHTGLELLTSSNLGAAYAKII